MQPIIVGVDGSRESGAAAAAGYAIALAANERCQLVHAARDVVSALDLAESSVSAEAVQNAMLARERADLATALLNYVPRHVIATMDVRTGRPAGVLADVVTELDAAMVVLGGKHHSALGRWLGGSTVQQAVRRLNVPLLVTAGELRPRPRILVAVDPSYAAVPTIQRAVAYARLVGGPLHALHVVEPVPTLTDLPFVSSTTDYADWSRERIERDVWTLLPIPDHHKVIRTGIALETIVQEAAAWRADVIVVGSHGKGWMDRLLIGSVTEDLLNDLPAAVLVIPVPAPERQRVRHIEAAAAPA